MWTPMQTTINGNHNSFINQRVTWFEVGLHIMFTSEGMQHKPTYVCNAITPHNVLFGWNVTISTTDLEVSPEIWVMVLCLS